MQSLVLISLQLAQEVSERAAAVVLDHRAAANVVEEVPGGTEITTVNTLKVLDSTAVMIACAPDLVNNEAKIRLGGIEGFGQSHAFMGDRRPMEMERVCEEVTPALVVLPSTREDRQLGIEEGGPLV